MPPLLARAAALVVTALATVSAAAETIVVPPGIATHADGRLPLEALYPAFQSLTEEGWTLETIVESRPEGTAAPLPIVALRSPMRGAAVWILAGIHGEEPAGPNAVAAAIRDIAALGRRRPVVLLPLLNPQGYARNWRYLNVPAYSESVDGQSVGDSSHLLPAAGEPARARAAGPSSPEADAITAYVVRSQADYPVEVSVDLHEDNLIHRGYVYSQGVRGERDELAAAAVRVLRDNGVPIQMDGRTRFDEPISQGIIGPVTDSSIDELMGARAIVAGSAPRPGPGAVTVLVLETPAAALPLERRVAAHAALLRLLATQPVAAPAGD